MSDHKTRVRKLEQRFSEHAASRTLDKLLDAFHRGDLVALEAQERVEAAANGKAGWVGNLLYSILQPMADTPLIAAEDLERPSA